MTIYWMLLNLKKAFITSDLQLQKVVRQNELLFRNNQKWGVSKTPQSNLYEKFSVNFGNIMF